MANATREQNAANQAAQPPAWVIEHLISLSEFADREELSAFSKQLLDAAETFLEEWNGRVPVPRATVVPDTGAHENVILLDEARRVLRGTT